MSRTQQRVVTGALVGGAAIAMGLAIAYQGERLPDDAPVIVGDDLSSGGAAAPAPDATEAASSVDPVEAFLPRSGEASACREPVGVDLLPGYAATLTINGIEIPPEEMNVVVNADGTISDELTASRSLSQYTFGPEEDCPNGRVLRPTNNVVRACVYRLEDGPDNCTITEFSFDVL